MINDAYLGGKNRDKLRQRWVMATFASWSIDGFHCLITIALQNLINTEHITRTLINSFAFSSETFFNKRSIALAAVSFLKPSRMQTQVKSNNTKTLLIHNYPSIQLKTLLIHYHKANPKDFPSFPKPVHVCSKP